MTKKRERRNNAHMYEETDSAAMSESERGVRTVYIMGAGASHHAGYPLIGTMAQELFAWMLQSQSPLDQFKIAAEFLCEEFGASPNIEEVLTRMSAEIRNLEESTEENSRIRRHEFIFAMTQVRMAIREWFREIGRRSAPGYAAFARNIIQPGDAVLTFNYDDSLERELKQAGKWDLSNGYGFPLGSSPQESPVLVLKLHGSATWFAELFGGAKSGFGAVGAEGAMGGMPVIHKADAQCLGFPNFQGRTYNGGGTVVPIILPTRNKQFYFDTSLGNEWGEFWDSLWYQATVVLQRAQSVMVAGLGLQPIDERACELILNSPPKDVPVIISSGSQSQRIASDFRRHGFTNVKVDQQLRFEDWVETTCAKSGRLRAMSSSE